MSRTIVFTHANGFPAGTYRKLFSAWAAEGWRVLAPDKLGHDPAYPVVSNWRPTRDELIRFIDTSGVTPPVHLVGHSLGGYLSLLVACRRPDLVASVVLVDSPVLAGWRAQSIRVAKLTHLIGRVSPGRVSQRRRREWPSPEAVRQHFGGKPTFARWDPEVLDDYLHCGFVPAADGMHLAFRREIETRLYNAIPHHLGTLLQRRPPRCPVGFVGGSQSAEVRQAGLAATRRATRGRIEIVQGTHLFPMEHPLQAAAAVLRLLAPEAPPAPA